MAKAMLRLIALAGTTVAVARVTCPNTNKNWQYNPRTDKCYAQVDVATHWDCELRVCRPLNASLACMNSVQDELFVHKHVYNVNYSNMTKLVGMWFGMAEVPHIEGKWGWTDSGCTSHYKNWAYSHNEPNDNCGEDCAGFPLPTINISDHATVLNGTWFDDDCGVVKPCLCEWPAQQLSPFYESIIPTLIQETGIFVPGCWGLNGEFMSCRRHIQNHYPVFEVVYAVLGIVCLGVIVYCLVKMTVLNTGGRVREVVAATPSTEVAESAYGQLLDSTTSEGRNVDRIVNLWVIRGALCSMLYSIVLLFLALTFWLHLRGHHISWVVDILEALVLAACKLAVARCAQIVHTHLTPWARAAAGPWIMALAVSMLLHGMAQVVLVFPYQSVAVEGPFGPSFCNMAYYFLISLLVSTCCQCLTGVSMFMLHESAMQHCTEKVFSRVVGNWWLALVVGTFGSAFCTWLAGAMGELQTYPNVFLSMSFLYVLAAIGQATAGLAIIMINRSMKMNLGGCDSSVQMGSMGMDGSNI